MRIKTLFCFIAVIAIFIACKKNTAGNEGVPPVFDSVTTTQQEQKPDRKKEILDSFVKLFTEEAKKWPVSFQHDTTGQRQLWTDNLGLLTHEKLRSSKYLLFVDGGVNNRSISIGAYTLAGGDVAENIIKDHCDAYYLADKKGYLTDFIMENRYAKYPYYAFCVDSTIFEITATNTVGHILHNVVGKLKEEYWYCISRNNAIPCDRDYIPQKLANKLKPALNKWLKYHKADISDFYTDSSSDNIKIELYNKPFEEDTLSLYYRKYGKEDDVYQPVLYDYSPNRRYYLTVRETSGVYKEEDGKWYYRGGDDCQEVYLVNRNTQKKVMVMWLGTGAFAEAAFWADNETYVIVGHCYYSPFPSLFINIGGVYYYSDMADLEDKSYFENDLKHRGVIVD